MIIKKFFEAIKNVLEYINNLITMDPAVVILKIN